MSWSKHKPHIQNSIKTRIAIFFIKLTDWQDYLIMHFVQRALVKNVFDNAETH